MALSPISLEHAKAKQWIEEMAAICQPKDIYLCDGSQEEDEALCQQMIATGTFIPLNPKRRPHSFLCRTTADDVARVEECTFICSEHKEDAGPTNHWKDPREMRQELMRLFRGAMRGRTLYVIPFSMGPVGSHIAKIGIQITDSPYVVCNMRMMTRMGAPIWKLLGKEGSFVPCMHSIGAPLEVGQQDIPWPCDSRNKHIVHFPETREIWSYGSGYGGNALLGKKCFALRIASVLGRDEGWLAEHMLILGLTNPQGKKRYIAAAFPSACGKTNLAMLTPTLPGWKVETVGDDIAWMKLGADGRLYAINPEAGFFGVAPGTSMQSNPNAMKTITKNAIFTNTALTDEGDVWWEGMNDLPPQHAISWKNTSWTPASGEKAAHPNARFTVSASQCPVMDPAWENPEGVPISAVIFGGRRADTIPLVREAFSWQHGVFLGACTSSETTAAAAGELGKLRHDPFAMLPFCGYHMGDYFAHWLSFKERTAAANLPRIYTVNWFQKDAEGKILWPGYGENSRVLAWIFERCEGHAKAKETAIGYLPHPEDLNLQGLHLSTSTLDTLLKVDPEAWKREMENFESYFQMFGKRLPSFIPEEIKALRRRLETA